MGVKNPGSSGYFWRDDLPVVCGRAGARPSSTTKADPRSYERGYGGRRLSAECEWRALYCCSVHEFLKQDRTPIFVKALVIRIL
jgi:hypothetical protein